MSRVTELHVNGAARSIDVAPDKPLLQVLREDLGLTGSKVGCGEGQCGTCTVLIDGEQVRSCVVPVESMMGKRITTIEGLEEDGRLHPIQQAFLDCAALQCGYCTPGMVISGVALLKAKPSPTEDEIIEFMQGNICRCGCYPRIVRAIQQAATVMSEQQVAGGVR